MISILEELINNIKKAEGMDISLLESQLNEKKRFVSKKKKRLQQKQQAQNNQTNPVKKEEPKSQLIKYNPNMATETPNEFTQEFIGCRDKFAAITQKYFQVFKQADAMWEKVGKDKPCPKEAWDLYVKGLQGFQQEIQGFISNDLQTNVEKMLPVEIQFLEQQLRLSNGFITKSEKMIDAINPEAFVDEETQKQIKAKPLEIEDKQKQDNQDNPELTSDQYKTNVDKTQKDLLTYQKFMDEFEDVEKIIEEQIKKDEEAKRVPNPNNLSKTEGPWVERTFWAFVESPIATDAVKMFMYSNPITAAIFDGKFGKLGFKDGLNWIKGISQQKRQQAEKDAEEARKKNSDKYDKNGIPQSLEKLSVNDIKRELYGNKVFVKLVNTLYNYPEVDKEDKKTLLDTTKFLNKELLQKDRVDRSVRSEILQNFKDLVETTKECCEYLDWDNYSDWKDVETIANSKEENDSIKGSTSKKEAKKAEVIKNIQNKIKSAKYTSDDYMKAVKELGGEPFNYNVDNIDTAWNKYFNQQESFIDLNKYNQLLECALGNETKGEI